MTDKNQPIFSAKSEPSSTAGFITDKIDRYNLPILSVVCHTKISCFLSSDKNRLILSFPPFIVHMSSASGKLQPDKNTKNIWENVQAKRHAHFK